MEDYQSNAKKLREQQSEKVIPDKHIERVVTGDVAVQKKTVWGKFKQLIIVTDAKTVVSYVFFDVIIPGAKNMLFDAGSETLRRALFGQDPRHRTFGTGSRMSYTQYNDPVRRGYSELTSRFTRSMPQDPRLARSPSGDNFVVSTREEAEGVVTQLNDIIDQWDTASVADLNEMLGVPKKDYTDNNWGWSTHINADIRQIREGWLINLPSAQPI